MIDHTDRDHMDLPPRAQKCIQLPQYISLCNVVVLILINLNITRITAITANIIHGRRTV